MLRRAEGFTIPYKIGYGRSTHMTSAPWIRGNRTMKCFNTTAVCIPEKHYMVDLSERVARIEKLVDAGKYFTINRARQYGKTTTLNALKKALQDRYLVLYLDFQSIDNDVFENGATFTQRSDLCGKVYPCTLNKTRGYD